MLSITVETNEVDDKAPTLLTNGSVVVLVTRFIDKDRFQGVVIGKMPDNLVETFLDIGDNHSEFNTKYFKPFYGTVTITNE